MCRYLINNHIRVNIWIQKIPRSIYQVYWSPNATGTRRLMRRWKRPRINRIIRSRISTPVFWIKHDFVRKWILQTSCCGSMRGCRVKLALRLGSIKTTVRMPRWWSRRRRASTYMWCWARRSRQQQRARGSLRPWRIRSSASLWVLQQREGTPSCFRLVEPRRLLAQVPGSSISLRCHWPAVNNTLLFAIKRISSSDQLSCSSHQL